MELEDGAPHRLRGFGRRYALAERVPQPSNRAGM